MKHSSRAEPNSSPQNIQTLFNETLGIDSTPTSTPSSKILAIAAADLYAQARAAEPHSFNLTPASRLHFRGASDSKSSSNTRSSPKRPLSEASDGSPLKKVHTENSPFSSGNSPGFSTLSLEPKSIFIKKSVCRNLFQEFTNIIASSSGGPTRPSLSMPLIPAPISIPERVPSMLEISNLLSELDSLSHAEQFNLESLTLCMEKLDKSTWAARRDEEIKKTLYQPSFFLRLSDVKKRVLLLTSPTETHAINKVISRVVTLGLSHMTLVQKKELFKTLTKDSVATDETYDFLSKDCFKKYFQSIDVQHPIEKLPSGNQVLLNVIQLCKNNLNDETQKVINYALHELKKMESASGYEIDRFYHFTNPANILSIIQNGIQVTHEKLYKGAFVSTHLETSFGKFGITVSSKELIGKEKSCCKIDRQFEEDSGAIWIASLDEPIKVLPDKILYSSEATAADIANLKAELQANKNECEFISADVYRLFLNYSRRRGWAIPVPQMMTPGRLALKKRGSEA